MIGQNYSFTIIYQYLIQKHNQTNIVYSNKTSNVNYVSYSTLIIYLC